MPANRLRAAPVPARASRRTNRFLLAEPWGSGRYCYNKDNTHNVGDQDHH